MKLYEAEHIQQVHHMVKRIKQGLSISSCNFKRSTKIDPKVELLDKIFAKQHVFYQNKIPCFSCNF